MNFFSQMNFNCGKGATIEIEKNQDNEILFKGKFIYNNLNLKFLYRTIFVKQIEKI